MRLEKNLIEATISRRFLEETSRTGAAGNELGDRAISRTETKPFSKAVKKLGRTGVLKHPRIADVVKGGARTVLRIRKERKGREGNEC